MEQNVYFANAILAETQRITTAENYSSTVRTGHILRFSPNVRHHRESECLISEEEDTWKNGLEFTLKPANVICSSNNVHTHSSC